MFSGSELRFPVKDPECCRQWLNAAKNQTEKLKNVCVCSQHFECLNGGEKLKETAVLSVSPEAKRHHVL